MSSLHDIHDMTNVARQTSMTPSLHDTLRLQGVLPRMANLQLR